MKNLIFLCLIIVLSMPFFFLDWTLFFIFLYSVTHSRRTIYQNDEMGGITRKMRQIKKKKKEIAVEKYEDVQNYFPTVQNCKKEIELKKNAFNWNQWNHFISFFFVEFPFGKVEFINCRLMWNAFPTNKNFNYH